MLPGQPGAAVLRVGGSGAVVSEPKSTESAFWDDHADRELTEVEREFVVGLRARVYNRAFHAATFPPFVYPNPKAKNKNPKPACLPAERGVSCQLQLTCLNPVPCPKVSCDPLR